MKTGMYIIYHHFLILSYPLSVIQEITFWSNAGVSLTILKFRIIN